MIFVDTSAIIALEVPSDKFHKRALRWREEVKDPVFVSSNLVFIETISWVRHNSGKEIAVRIGFSLLSGEGIHLERVTLEDENKAWDLFQKIEGRGISMIDCTSFVLMKRLKINNVFAFDSDFMKLGFKVYPS